MISRLFLNDLTIAQHRRRQVEARCLRLESVSRCYVILSLGCCFLSRALSSNSSRNLAVIPTVGAVLRRKVERRFPPSQAHVPSPGTPRTIRRCFCRRSRRGWKQQLRTAKRRTAESEKQHAPRRLIGHSGLEGNSARSDPSPPRLT